MRERFEDLIGGEDVTPEERARLRRVHELLLQVGPPPEVPARLRAPATARLGPRRRRSVPALIAAALAAAAFGSGYLAGDRDGAPESVRSIPMTGVGEARGATASIELLAEDEAGNWPMDLLVRGLEPNARSGDWYELWLTKGGKLVASCGRFTVDDGETTVRLSVPYRLRGFDGWVVTRRGSDTPLLST